MSIRLCRVGGGGVGVTNVGWLDKEGEDMKKGREQMRGAGEQQGERVSCEKEIDRGVSEPDVMREQLQVSEHKKNQKYVSVGRAGSRFRKETKSSSTAATKKGRYPARRAKKRGLLDQVGKRVVVLGEGYG